MGEMTREIAPVFNINDSLSLLQLLYIGEVTAAYLGEAILKIIVYFNKFKGVSKTKIEQIIYSSSAILDLAQMSGSFLGLGA